MRIVLRAARRWSAYILFVRRNASAGTPYRNDNDGIESLFGSTKCSTSGASDGGFFDFSCGNFKLLCAEYGGNSSPVWCSSGGEYVGGSRRPCGGRGDGPVAI